MKDAERQLLRILDRMGKLDPEEVAGAMGVSADYVRKVWSRLESDGLLRVDPQGRYFLPDGGVRGPKLRIVPSGTEDGPEGAGLQPGQKAGEIRLLVEKPPREKVREALRRNPGHSFEQMEQELTAYTLECPASGRRIRPTHPLGCATCPHQAGLDYPGRSVRCEYEFSARRLGVTHPDETGIDGGVVQPLPVVDCPLYGQVVTIDRCTDCRYFRGGSLDPERGGGSGAGWVDCGCPWDLPTEDGGERVIEVWGEQVRVKPMPWE